MGRVRQVGNTAQYGVPLDKPQTALLAAFGKNVKRLRETRGLTQEKLAEAANLNWRTVQKIEAGNINLLITTVERLKAALGANWEDLLGR